MMITSCFVPICFLLVATSATCTFAFVPVRPSASDSLVAVKMTYVPEGMTPEQWKKLKEEELKKSKRKDFAAVGPRSFQSRSLQSFQKDMEKGQTSHLFPVFEAKKLIAAGKIKPEEVPYMQRGGKWDNSDVKGAKKKAWNEADKKYNPNPSPTTPGYLGFVERRAAAAAAAAAEKPTDKKVASQPPPKAEPKKLFGLF